ncbi:MAG: TadE/TadG family type IV pilus assembly protein [Acidobacteriaceae bacterium]|nr:TadE/TadG family type IV pilus assembly protein [Acidobacteriaceae bacterium]
MLKQDAINNLRLGADQKGSSLLEVAIVLPLLVLLLAVAVDLGNACTAAITTASAAHAGALYGTANPTDTAGMVQAARTSAPSLPTLVPVATYGCECSDGSSAVGSCSIVPICAFNSIYYVELDTTYVYTPLIPYPGLTDGFVLHGKARLRAAR